MNNQAAQTMPALVGEALTYFAKAGDDGDRRYVEAIRQHISALSQTAGVAEGMVIVPLFPTPEMDAAGKAALSDNGVDNVEDSDALVCYAAMVRAAPAASGGDVAFRSCTCHTENDKRLCMNKRECVVVNAQSAPQPPAAASVSERARVASVLEPAETLMKMQLHAGERGNSSDLTGICEDSAKPTKAEQALTQQRGECYCLACKGSGEVIGLHASPSGDPQDDYDAPMACPKCDGTGDEK